MKVEELSLKGLKLLTPLVFKDERGFFFESFSLKNLEDPVLDFPINSWCQENHSRSFSRVIRGLHYQSVPGQAKLIRCGNGAIVDVVVDIRPESPTFGKHEKIFLDSDSQNQLYIPVGFAHGFSTLSYTADVLYKVDSYYNATEEKTLQWDDPDLNIDWEVNDPIVSDRDKSGESFASLKTRLFK